MFRFFKQATYTSLVIVTGLLCKKVTHGFSVHSITHTLEEGTAPLPDYLQLLEKQKFYYLGKGAQAFVFVSQDHKTVIKFLRFDHLLPKVLIRLFHFLPYPYIQSRLLRSEREIKELLTSFTLAKTCLETQTAIYHFQSRSLPHPLTIIDPIGIEHKITKAPFIIQQFVSPLEAQLESLTYEQCTHLIDQFISLTKHRQDQGIKDKDPNLLTNFGFADNKLIEFDIGRFYTDTYADPLKRQEEARKIISVLWPKLLPKYPHLKDYFELELNNL